MLSGYTKLVRLLEYSGSSSWALFRGFDGNNEAAFYAFVRFLQKHGLEENANRSFEQPFPNS